MAIETHKIKLYCGWCGHKGIYNKITEGQKGRVSDVIHCEECNKILNHKRTWK